MNEKTVSLREAVIITKTGRDVIKRMIQQGYIKASIKRAGNKIYYKIGVSQFELIQQQKKYCYKINYTQTG